MQQHEQIKEVKMAKKPAPKKNEEVAQVVGVDPVLVELVSSGQINEEPIQQPPPAPPEEPVTASQTSTPPVATSLIEIDSRGMIRAKNNAELMRVLRVNLLAKAVPDRFDTVEKLFGAIMFVRELGLNDTAIRQVANIHGVPSLFGDLPLALVQSKGQLAYFKEQWFDKDYKEICFENKNLNAEAWGAVVYIARSTIINFATKLPDVQTFSFTLDDASKAGMYPAKRRDGSISNDSPWMKYTKLMLRYKARAIGLKSMFADAINGVSIAEYDHDVMGSENMKDVAELDPARELANVIKGSA